MILYTSTVYWLKHLYLDQRSSALKTNQHHRESAILGCALLGLCSGPLLLASSFLQSKDVHRFSIQDCTYNHNCTLPLKQIMKIHVLYQWFWGGSDNASQIASIQGCILTFSTTLPKFTSCLMYVYHIYMVSVMSCSYSNNVSQTSMYNIEYKCSF